MKNNVELTDDELSVIMTALTMTVSSFELHIEKNGTSKLNLMDLQAYSQTKELKDKLQNEYFGGNQ